MTIETVGDRRYYSDLEQGKVSSMLETAANMGINAEFSVDNGTWMALIAPTQEQIQAFEATL